MTATEKLKLVALIITTLAMGLAFRTGHVTEIVVIAVWWILLVVWNLL